MVSHHCEFAYDDANYREHRISCHTDRIPVFFPGGSTGVQLTSLVYQTSWNICHKRADLLRCEVLYDTPTTSSRNTAFGKWYIRRSLESPYGPVSYDFSMNAEIYTLRRTASQQMNFWPILCTFRLWFFMNASRTNLSPQTSQLYGFSPVWYTLCVLRPVQLRKTLSHISQQRTGRLAEWCRLMWSFRTWTRFALYPHSMTRKGLFHAVSDHMRFQTLRVLEGFIAFRTKIWSFSAVNRHMRLQTERKSGIV